MTLRRTPWILIALCAGAVCAPGSVADARTPVGAVTVSPPVPTPASTPQVAAIDLERLRARALAFPVAGVDASTVRDSFEEIRGARRHEAIDIVAPRGSAVVAVDDGIVVKLFTSVPGGLTVYQFDPAGSYCYYYAHLDRYAEGLREGAVLRKGAPLGNVGTSGNAGATAHLHFALFKLGPAKHWWQGTAIDPYPILVQPAVPRVSPSPIDPSVSRR